MSEQSKDAVMPNLLFISFNGPIVNVLNLQNDIQKQQSTITMNEGGKLRLLLHRSCDTKAENMAQKYIGLMHDETNRIGKYDKISRRSHRDSSGFGIVFTIPNRRSFCKTFRDFKKIKSDAVKGKTVQKLRNQ